MDRTHGWITLSDLPAAWPEYEPDEDEHTGLLEIEPPPEDAWVDDDRLLLFAGEAL